LSLLILVFILSLTAFWPSFLILWLHSCELFFSHLFYIMLLIWSWWQFWISPYFFLWFVFIYINSFFNLDLWLKLITLWLFLYFVLFHGKFITFFLILKCRSMMLFDLYTQRLFWSMSWVLYRRVWLFHIILVISISSLLLIIVRIILIHRN